MIRPKWSALVFVEPIDLLAGPRKVTLSGSEGIVSQPIDLATKNRRHPAQPVQFWIHGKTIIGPVPRNGGYPLIDFWRYPAGGNPTQAINLHRSVYLGVTVSVAPSRQTRTKL